MAKKNEAHVALEIQARIRAQKALTPDLEEHRRLQLIEIGAAISNLIDAVKTLTVENDRDCMGPASLAS